MGSPIEEPRLSFTEKALTIIWMNEINSRLGSPLVDVDTKVIKRYTISVEWISVRPKNTDMLRCQV
jgi:hypothetical protein